MWDLSLNLAIRLSVLMVSLCAEVDAMIGYFSAGAMLFLPPASLVRCIPIAQERICFVGISCGRDI